MAGYLETIEKALDDALPRGRPETLAAAMRWAVGAGGKRIRPQICLAAAVAAGGKAEDAVKPACAIELLHNYTLVHDDLPAMDDDRERRGKPSVWAKFGEANAILAGDALQALAFRVAADAPRNAAAVVAALGDRGVGVVAGQVEDVAREDASRPLDAESVDFVYAHKTADLFVAAAQMGALAGGGDAASVAKLGAYAFHLGLAFQFEDDLIDGDSPYSREKTEALVREHTRAALDALDGLPGDVAFLKTLAEGLVGRSA
ncbi:MAG: polyprenyl synthetase family protein [Kiritimatiellae bacterium]|nr:polyprenyl synthetase family protein [Kiritimatiellia bacterium]